MIDRIRKLLAPAKGTPAQLHAVPEQDYCDPMPEEHRLVIALNAPSPLPNVTISGRFGENAFLTLDRRTPPEVKITVNGHMSQTSHDNISLSLGHVRQGRANFGIAGSNIDMVAGNSVRFYAKFGFGPDSYVRVGEGTTSNGIEVSCARGRVLIGRNCQTAGESMVMGSAHHGVVDLSSGKPVIVTKTPDLRIGNHVWLGSRCYIGSNARIGDGCIVAANASVVGEMPANCLIAGNPAKVHRKNVGWSRSPFVIDPGSKAYFAQLKLEEQI